MKTSEAHGTYIWCYVQSLSAENRVKRIGTAIFLVEWTGAKQNLVDEAS